MYDARTLKPTMAVSEQEVECPVAGCETIVPAYWSLRSWTGTAEPLLSSARTMFREVVDRGTEPDLYIESDDTL